MGKQIVREYIYAYAAVSPKDGASCHLILPAMDKKCLEVFLEELSSLYAEEFLLVVYDNAPCHRSTKLRVPKNIKLTGLPPYSPELNPVENCWDEMREKFFKNLVFDSIAAVEEKLVEACQSFEEKPQTLKSITAWKWIINSL